MEPIDVLQARSTGGQCVRCQTRHRDAWHVCLRGALVPSGMANVWAFMCQDCRSEAADDLPRAPRVDLLTGKGTRVDLGITTPSVTVAADVAAVCFELKRLGTWEPVRAAMVDQRMHAKRLRAKTKGV